MSASATHSRTTVVTGARSGIGRATAELLRGRGERVVGVDIQDCEVNADLGTPPGRARALAALRECCPGGLDALIGCAGVAHGDPAAIVSVNYFGTVALAEGLRPALARGQSPRAVLVASTASLHEVDESVVAHCLKGEEERARLIAMSASAAQALARQGAIYGASKRALTRWIRRTAPRAEWAGAGILLNGVSPGLVRTPMTLPLLAKEEGRALLARSVPRALPEPAEPEDIALLLAFLASRDNRYLVGQVPYCDGGTEVTLRGDAIG